MIYPLKTNKKYESIKQNQSRDLKLIRLYNLSWYKKDIIVMNASWNVRERQMYKKNKFNCFCIKF